MKMSFKGIVKTVVLSAICAVPFIAASSAHAAIDTCTWTGGGVNENFSNAANWTGCDNGNVPQNGDSLILPTSVDANTVYGNNRVLNNDLVSASFGGIQVTGTYMTGDYDYYRIGGSNFSTSGNIDGNSTADGYPEITLLVDLTVTSPVTLAAVYSTGSLAIGANATRLESSVFEGGLSGSGALTLYQVSQQGGPGNCANGITEPTPFAGDSTAFSGTITLSGTSHITITSQLTGFARHASSITAGQFSGINFFTDSGQDMSFSTPLNLNGTSISVYQSFSDIYCNTEPSIVKNLTLTSPISLNGGTEFFMGWANVIVSGSVSNPEFLNVAEGQTTRETLTVGTTVKKSALATTTYTGNTPLLNAYAPENNLVIVSEGATINDALVYGGTLKGKGTVGVLTMSSGTIAPGLSPGCLTSGNLTYTGGSLEIELEGTTVCTQYDQQIVNGTVDLGAATTLNILKGSAYSPALNSVYTIISNDGSDAVTGTFAGLAQGATAVLGSYSYRISYTGGDGNDVTLTVVAVPAAVVPAKAPNTGFSRLTLSTILPIVTIIAGTTLFTGKRILARRKI
jgi:fibronectin-binding autotransporter adhesin